MKKISLIFLFLLFCMNLSVMAVTENKEQDSVSKIEIENNETISLTQVNLYDYFYKVEEAIGLPIFIPLTEEKIARLDKESKKIYNKVLKSDRYVVRALGEKYRDNHKKQISLYSKAILNNSQNYFAKILLSTSYFQLKDYVNALLQAESVIEDIRPELKDAYVLAGYSNYYLSKFKDSLGYLDSYIKSSGVSKEAKAEALYIQASSYYMLNDYNTAINKANLSINQSKTYELSCLQIKYSSYLALKNKKMAKQEAWKLIKLNPSAENYLKIAYCTDDQNEKLGYLKKAKSFYVDPNDIFKVNCQIFKIEQNKIDRAHKTIGVFSEKPDWLKIANENIGSVSYWNRRQDEFFESTNACIANYKGSNLAKCFENVIKNEKEKTAQLKKELYEAQMLLIQQQQVSALQYNNYLQAQQNYILSRPRYTNSTITPVGNTYYVNSYSY